MVKPRLLSPETEAFADFWFEARDAVLSDLPFKGDLLKSGFQRFMPQLAISEKDEKGKRRYTLFGTGLVKDFGADLTGRYSSDFMTEEGKVARQRAFDAFWAAYPDQAEPGLWTLGKARTSTGRMIDIETASFPILEIRGDRINRIGHSIVLGGLDYGEDMLIRYPDIELELFDATGPRPDWLYCAKENESQFRGI